MELPNSETSLDLEPFFLLSHDYLCIPGYDGYFRKVNPAFIKLMGYSVEELFARPISHFIHPQDKEITSDNRDYLKKDTPLLNFENRYITKTGEIVWLTWTSTPVPDQELIYAIAKNITHLKKMEEERRVLIKDLTSLNSGLKQLSYTTSHDLRSPVNNLISLCSLLDLSKIEDEETLLYLELLEKSAHRLKSTLNNQVDHLKDNLLLKSNLEPVNLKEVHGAIADSLRFLIESSRTTFVIDFSEVDLLVVNSFYLHSIFLNLITNSIKYAKPGIPPVITITSKEKTDAYQIRFSDNGIGFDVEEIKDKLFGLRQVFTDNSDSKGVGLYLVKNYMNSLGGDIEVTSEINVGSVFTLNFKRERIFFDDPGIFWF